jgi:hypothetical protein
MTEMKGVGRRRRTQLLDDLETEEAKEDAEDRKRWKRQFISRIEHKYFP